MSEEIKGENDEQNQNTATTRREGKLLHDTANHTTQRNHDIRKLLRKNRRGFLRSLSELGLSGLALKGLTKGALAQSVENPNKEVPRLKGYRYKEPNPDKRSDRPEREPVYYSIPESEWFRRQSVKNASRRLHEKYSEKNIEFGLGNRDGDLVVIAKHVTYANKNVAQDGSSEGEKSEPKIPFDQIEEELPGKTTEVVERGNKKYKNDNIPVVVEKVTRIEQDYESMYRPVPAGCEAGDSWGSNPEWTIGLPAHDWDLADGVLVTASHCVGHSTGTSVYQPSSHRQNIIGSSEEVSGSGNGDVATILPSDGVSVKYDVAAQGGGYEGWPIVGTLYQNSIEDMIDDGDYVYVQGRKTGRHYEQIEDLLEPGWGAGDKVVIAADTSSGDSGGAYFSVDSSGDAWRLGIHAWATGPSYTWCAGNTFYYAEGLFNLI